MGDWTGLNWERIGIDDQKKLTYIHSNSTSKDFHIHRNLSLFKVSTAIRFAKLHRIELSCVNHWRTKRLAYCLSILLVSYCTIWKDFNLRMISNLYLLGGRLMSRRLLRICVSKRKSFKRQKKNIICLLFPIILRVICRSFNDQQSCINILHSI